MSCSLFCGSDNECDMVRKPYYPARKKVSVSEVKGKSREVVLLLSEIRVFAGKLARLDVQH